MKKAIIYDLDNTIYPVPSIGEKLFGSLFQLIAESGEHAHNMSAVCFDIMRKPFQVVAAYYQFSNELTEKGIDLLKDLTYEGEISPFPDYVEILKLPPERFLVTTGFYKLQFSKIKGMGIEGDFKEIHIVDPLTGTQTKKEVFALLMKTHHYYPNDLLVVGDDPSSELKAAAELGIEAVLYDPYQLHNTVAVNYKITNFKELSELI